MARPYTEEWKDLVDKLLVLSCRSSVKTNFFRLLLSISLSSFLRLVNRNVSVKLIIHLRFDIKQNQLIVLRMSLS